MTDFLSFISWDVTRWILGTKPGPSSQRALKVWVDARYRQRLAQCLEESRQSRDLGRSLWERLTSGDGSPGGDIWTAANLPRPITGEGGLGGDAALHVLKTKWQAIRRQWPSPEAECIAGAPEALANALSQVPTRLVSDLSYVLGGIEGVSGLIPPSLSRDPRVLGSLYRRAMQVGAHLGAPGDGFAHLGAEGGGALRRLLSAHRHNDLKEEGEALRECISRMEGAAYPGILRALRHQSLALSLKRGDGDGAARVVDVLSQDAEAGGRWDEAYEMQALGADVATSPELQGQALRKGGDYALKAGATEEAIVLIRRRAALHEGQGELRDAGEAWSALGQIFLDTGRPREAALAAGEGVERLGRAAARGPLARALALRGRADLSLGRQAQGERDLRQALALSDDEALSEAVRALLGVA